MLCQPPYSLINLTENLFPFNIDATVLDLIDVIEQYQKEETDGLEILELTLKNLAGDQKESYNYAWKWRLIQNNSVWAKKLWTLICELEQDHKELYEGFRCAQLIKEDLLGTFFEP